MRDATHNKKRGTRLLLVDDHAILREGLTALLDLESDLEVVGQASSCDIAIALAERLQPDVVITDLALPGGTGLHVITAVRNVAPHTHLLVLTVHNSEEYIRAALKAGADGYVLKDASRADLLQAIRQVSRGARYLCESVSAKIVSVYLSDRDAQPETTAQLLTGREREVLIHVANGLSNKRIAQRLGLSVKTVEKHRSNFMRKLQLHNTASITMFAICKGLVSPDELALQPDS